MRFPRVGRKRSTRPMTCRKRIAVFLVVALGLILIPSSAVNADSPKPGNAVPVKSTDLGSRGSNGQASGFHGSCVGPGLPPESYGQGLDGMVGLQSGKNITGRSTYGQYGTAGQYWNWVGFGCLDVMPKIGNHIANSIFDIAKAVDAVTIGIYVNVSSDNMTNWLKGTADHLITKIGSAIQARYLTLIILIGSLALIWWGLFKRRATKVTEGAIWMICATVALTALINKPEIFTTAGSAVTEATTQVVNVAIPAGSAGKSQWGGPYDSSACLVSGDHSNPQYTGEWGVSGKGGKPNAAVTTASVNANNMWSVLVCKPWLQGEFGTADPRQRVVSDLSYGLLKSQAYSRDEVANNTYADKQKENQYAGVAETLKNAQTAKSAGYPPGSYNLFVGKLYPQRIGIALAALFAAFAAGLLLLLLSLALLIFKLGFLLLLIIGPVFLLLGVHPGWGRVIATRWFELTLSTLLKQGLVAGLLSLLLYLYSLVIGNGLPWVLQIVLIATVTFAAFFYRKPFQHLFAAVGTDGIGSRILSNATAGSNVFKTPVKAAYEAGGVGTYVRYQRWGMRKAQPIADLAAASGDPRAVVVAEGLRQGTSAADKLDNSLGATSGKSGADAPTRAGRAGTSAPPLNLPRPGEGTRNGPGSNGGPGSTPRGGIRPGGGPTSVGSGAGPSGPRGGGAPPLNTPRSSGSAPPRPSSGGSWQGASWRSSGGAAAGPSGPNGPKPPSGGGNGPRRGGGGGWFGGGGSSRDGGSYDPPPPPRRAERRDNRSGPAPQRRRESAPPLWAKPSKPAAPDIPFWTRPDK